MNNMIRVPKDVVEKNKKIAKTLGIPTTKAFIVQDKIICEVLRQKKRKGKMKLEINWRY